MPDPSPTPGDIVRFENVSIEAHNRRGRSNILSDVSFNIRRGEAFGLVGESGCGKSTIALALMRYLPEALKITSGRILFEGQDLATQGEAQMRAIRGRRIAMVYQDPTASLNPVMKIGRQLAEVPMLHGERSPVKAMARARDMLGEVRLADPDSILGRYPHQLSGGQQQRVVIAMALMAEPQLLVMDEPTTGLDVTIEAAILELIADLRKRFGTAILFISHNLGTIARVSDRVGVLYAGRLVETGPIAEVFKAPAHPYTRGLLAAIPRLDKPSSGRLKPIEGTLAPADRARVGCTFFSRCAFGLDAVCLGKPIELVPVEDDALSTDHRAACARLAQMPSLSADETPFAPALTQPSSGEPVLTAHAVKKSYQVGGIFARKTRSVHALQDASFTAREHRTLAIVGESGSGKSTLAKVLCGLTSATAGSVTLDAQEIANLDVSKRSAQQLAAIQMVFQNPDGTLNPSHTVAFALERPLKRLSGLSAKAARAEARGLLDRVRLSPEFLSRKPFQLSGGQRQRVAIARALAGAPKLMIADEPVSALDVSVQAAIVNLLADLLQTSDMALILISHDLALVRHMADTVAVMYAGRIVDYGPADDVFNPPHHPYTAALLAAAPRPDPDAGPPALVLQGSMPSPTETIIGCAFAARCPSKIAGVCDITPPPERHLGPHKILCHLEF